MDTARSTNTIDKSRCMPLVQYCGKQLSIIYPNTCLCRSAWVDGKSAVARNFLQCSPLNLPGMVAIRSRTTNVSDALATGTLHAKLAHPEVKPGPAAPNQVTLHWTSLTSRDCGAGLTQLRFTHRAIRRCADDSCANRTPRATPELSRAAGPSALGGALRHPLAEWMAQAGTIR